MSDIVCVDKCPNTHGKKTLHINVFNLHDSLEVVISIHSFNKVSQYFITEDVVILVKSKYYSCIIM